MTTPYGDHTALNWFDFICPFCYVGQQRNAILAHRGFDVVALPFQAHPEIPAEGIAAASRNGPMYTMLQREADEVGLRLRWPPRLPNSRRALAAAEWARRHQPEASPQLNRDLFAAHFALGEDLGDPTVIDLHAAASGIDLDAMHAALADGSALDAVTEIELEAREYGVAGTPAWLVAGRLMLGLRPAAEFQRLS